MNGKVAMHTGLSLEDLHPRILHEVKEVQKSLPGVTVELVEKPSAAAATSVKEEAETYPSIEELEDHISCRRIREWNESVHLRLTYSDEVKHRGSNQCDRTI